MHDVYWPVPCIESLLILNDFLTGNAAAIAKLPAYFANANYFGLFIKNTLEALSTHGREAPHTANSLGHLYRRGCQGQAQLHLMIQ